jgi:hypothetical protein
MMTNKRQKMLWWLTGLVALGLLVTTLALFARADRVREAGILAHVTTSQAAPFLRDQPGNAGDVLMVLEFGAPVRIKDSATRNDQQWYLVDVGEMSGWLLASLISFDPPEPADQR